MTRDARGEAPGDGRRHWEAEADRWIAWARTPGHDAYGHYAPRFFELVPPAGRATLEIGCGEGRVCRDLARRGHHVTGVDAAPTLIAAARDADRAGRYLLGDAAALPLPAQSFDQVVAYNSLMDVDDMPGAVVEAARVLVPGGFLSIAITHPFADAGGFEERQAQAAFVVTGSYLEGGFFDEGCERNGLRMRFRGWRHPLEAYARALEGAGFVIEALREPAHTHEAVAVDPARERWRRMPMFLFARARKA